MGCLRFDLFWPSFLLSLCHNTKIKNFGGRVNKIVEWQWLIEKTAEIK